MTVSTEVSRNDYVGTGLVATYDYDFKIYDETDLLVTTESTAAAVTPLTYPIDYSVTGVGEEQGGTITLTAGALAAGYLLSIKFYTTLTQETDLRNQGGYFPEAVEDALDRLVKIDQQLDDKIARTIRAPDTDISIAEMPSAAARANKLWGGDAQGNLRTYEIGSGDVTDADNVNLLQYGTGPVSRSVRDNVRDHLRLTDFMTTAQKAAWRNQTLTTDFTTVAQTAWTEARASGRDLELDPGAGAFTGTPFTLLNSQTRSRIWGHPLRTRLHNIASANTPTIELFAAQYFDISGLILTGAAGFPNVAIKTLGPAGSITSITQVAGIATATMAAAHRLLVGDPAIISGAVQAGYNGTKTVLSTPTPTTITFAVDPATVSPATGTIIFASNRCGFGHLRSIVMQPNGIGIHFRDTNTVWLDDIGYWPSSGSTFGGTVDALTRIHAILADGTSSVNSINMNKLNVAGIELAADGGAAIRWNTTNISNDINLMQSELELSNSATYRTVRFNRVYGFSIEKTYLENSNLLFADSRYGEFQGNQCGATTIITCGDGTAPNACAYFDMSSMALESLVADVNNSNIDCENITTQAAWANDAVSSKRVGCNDGVVGALPDKISSSLGVRERDRAFAMGDDVTPTFAAGDYSSDVGTWVVATGNRATGSYGMTGKQMTMKFSVTGTDVTGTPAYLKIAIPLSKTVAKTVSRLISVQDNSANWTLGKARAVAGEAFIRLYTSVNLAGWANSTDQTGVEGELAFETA